DVHLAQRGVVHQPVEQREPLLLGGRGAVDVPGLHAALVTQFSLKRRARPVQTIQIPAALSRRSPPPLPERCNRSCFALAPEWGEGRPRPASRTVRTLR